MARESIQNLFNTARDYGSQTFGPPTFKKVEERERGLDLTLTPLFESTLRRELGKNTELYNPTALKGDLLKELEEVYAHERENLKKELCKSRIAFWLECAGLSSARKHSKQAIIYALFNIFESESSGELVP